MTLYLVRHAQPLVEPGVCYGALDLPADALATRLAAQALAETLPMGARLLSSPLQRCAQLATELCRCRPDLQWCGADARLAEMDFGCFEGQRWADIPRPAYDAWTADFWQHRFGGKESVAEVMARVSALWHAASACEDPAAAQVWVTHAGVIRAASLLAQGVQQIQQADQWPAAAPGYGQCWRLPCAPGQGLRR